MCCVVECSFAKVPNPNAFRDQEKLKFTLVFKYKMDSYLDKGIFKNHPPNINKNISHRVC